VTDEPTVSAPPQNCTSNCARQEIRRQVGCGNGDCAAEEPSATEA
jgi:hypothetical protein